MMGLGAVSGNGKKLKTEFVEDVVTVVEKKKCT